MVRQASRPYFWLLQADPLPQLATRQISGTTHCWVHLPLVVYLHAWPLALPLHPLLLLSLLRHLLLARLLGLLPAAALGPQLLAQSDRSQCRREHLHQIGCICIASVVIEHG